MISVFSLREEKELVLSSKCHHIVNRTIYQTNICFRFHWSFKTIFCACFSCLQLSFIPTTLTSVYVYRALLSIRRNVVKYLNSLEAGYTIICVERLYMIWWIKSRNWMNKDYSYQSELNREYWRGKMLDSSYHRIIETIHWWKITLSWHLINIHQGVCNTEENISSWFF